MNLKQKLTYCLIGIVLFLGNSACSYVDENEMTDIDTGVFINVTENAMLDRMEDSYSHCWGDINGDGLPDIFVINHVSNPSLFKNNGDGTFADITSYSGMLRGGDLHGCAIGDYDNDGDQDIYVTLGAEKGIGVGLNRLYQNNSKGQFKDIALQAAATDSKGRGRSASWVDYNNDGFLDLFIANNIRNDAPAALLKSNRDGTFTNVSIESGLNIRDNLAEASWIDYDNDGFMDLTVSILKKHLKGEIVIFKNMGDGTFKKSITFPGRAYVWGDYDNDGDMDLLISNPPRVHILQYEIDILSKIFKGFIKMYENEGGGRFIDVSGKSGFNSRMGGEKVILFDYDNDGDLDIYLLISGTKKNNINDMVFRNNSDKTFTNVTKAIGLNQKFKGRGSGVAFADYNNDGFLDLFLTNGQAREPYVPGQDRGPYVLYKNRGNNNHWLKIQLIGSKSNRDGIGARVKLKSGSQLQYRQNNGGIEGYIQNSSVITFGLSNATAADKIEVIWPSGSVTNLSNIKANQFLFIKENN